jgi:hypothetical protein
MEIRTILKYSLFAILFLGPFSCEKSSDRLDSYVTARITGFDLNCSTCILEFPDDLPMVRKILGKSTDNLYESVNLNKGDYETGQMLKVRITEPDKNDLKPCLALYPSNNYKEVYISDYKNFENMPVNDTAWLSYHDCLNDSENRFYLCFDSLLNDSRCPLGVECFWAGNAAVRLRLVKYDSKPVLFDLNSLTGFINDTIVDGYKFSFLDLRPYPDIHNKISLNDYKVKLLIQKQAP